MKNLIPSSNYDQQDRLARFPIALDILFRDGGEWFSHEWLALQELRNFCKN